MIFGPRPFLTTVPVTTEPGTVGEPIRSWTLAACDQNLAELDAVTLVLVAE
jgi:hypothetical protein